MAVCLDGQIFYVPPVVAAPKPASRPPRVQEQGPAITKFGVPSSPSLLQTTHNPQPSSAGGSQADAILIPTDDELDDVDNRSDVSFDSLNGLLRKARSKVQPGRISDTAGKGIDAASDDHNAPDPSVASMAGLGNESHASPRTLRAEQERLVPVSPTSRPWLECSGWSRRPVDRCPRHPNWTKFCRRFQNAKADDEGNKGGEPKPADAGLPLPPPNSQLEADRHPTNEMCPATPPQVVESSAHTSTLPDDESTGELEPAGAEPRLQPQSLSGAASGRGVDPQQRSSSCHLSQHRGHRDDSDRKAAESDWPKPATDPHRRSQSPHSAASSPRVETQQWPDPSVQDDRGEQNEGFAAPSQAQESRACVPRSPVEGSNVPELAHTEPSMQPSTGQDKASLQHDMGRHRQYSPDDGGVYSPVGDSVARHSQDNDVALPQTRLHRASRAQRQTTQRPKPRRSQCLSDVSEDQAQQRESGSVAPLQAQEVQANAEPSMQPPASQVGVKRQRDLSRHRRCSTDDREDYYPSVCSDTEHSENDAVRPPRRKRRRVSTVTVATGGTTSQRRTRPDRGDASPSQARGSSLRPMRRGKRSTARPPSPRHSTLERDPETDRDAAATFEEWPLGNAVFKRVTVDGSPPTFVVQFTWDPCATHGGGHDRTESRSSISSAQKYRPARQRNTRSPKDENPPAHAKSTSISRRARYTSEDDATICQLREQGLSWPAIAKHLPGRTAGAIEVRYHTKLKTVDPSPSESRQLHGCSRAPSPVVGDADEGSEWEVEEIFGHRRLDDDSVELLVKWKGGEETWTPYENLEEVEALDRYERLHGRVNVDSV